MAVLEEYQAISQDVLKVEHRSSEPMDVPLDPASIDTIDFEVGEVAVMDATGFTKRSTAATLEAGTQRPLGLFVLPRNPEDARKNDYVEASGNASVFTNGILTLNGQITDATVAAMAPLYATDDGGITTSAPTTPENAYIGYALSARTVAGADVRVKLEL